MKQLLIIYPHFPPSNLAGVHRPRLFAQHLPSFGWEPIILTVDASYYEEAPDYNLVKLLPPVLRLEKVKAFPVTRPRLIGDIGLRAFFQLYKKAKQLIQFERIDFLYIPIPSFYCALLGRWLHHSTGIKYGIDYIDPWVHHFPGSDQIFSRHWFSSRIANILEPIALKHAALITGVAAGYYKDALERNPQLLKQAITGAMPYGGEATDHVILENTSIAPYLFDKTNGKVQLVYAGAMLPKAYEPLEAMFKAIDGNREIFSQVEFHFIGTGSRVNDAESFTIKPLAEKYDLYNTVVFEYPKRIPYLDVLVHLKIADGIFILGSTEPHYTPSKTYQGILSGKYILAILHAQSSAVQILQDSGGGMVLPFNGGKDMQTIRQNFVSFFNEWNERRNRFLPGEVKQEVFEQYTAKAVTQQLAILLDRVFDKPNCTNND